MKGDANIIDILNKLLESELTSVDQYFIHSRMYEDWGLTKLYERIGHEMQDEIGHADRLIRRILFLEGTPDLSKRQPIKVGSNVKDMLSNDLELEYGVAKELKSAIAECEKARDYETRAMLVEMLEDTEEDHAYWLEKQLGLIDSISLENYLQSQM